MRLYAEQKTPADAAHKVTTDIYDDAERQNRTLDDTVCLVYPSRLSSRLMVLNRAMHSPVSPHNSPIHRAELPKRLVSLAASAKHAS